MNRLLYLVATLFIIHQLPAQANQQVLKKDIDKLVSISNPDYDMGRISSGKPLEYNIIIKNISADTITLVDVKAGCGCTTPKFRSNESLLPGKSTFVTLGFNGGASGEFSKFADIIFNGGLSKQVKFHGTAIMDSTSQKANLNRP